MSFSPGQIITAQRLNRLQPKTYWAQCSGSVNSTFTGDVPGTSMSIAVETNGATASFVWSCAVYGSGAMSGTGSNTRVQWDVNGSPTYALVQFQTATEKAVGANVWVTTIPTAGTYTFKMICVNVTNGQIQIYSAYTVVITEVA